MALSALKLVIFFACLNLAFADFSRVKRPIFRERTGRQAQSSEARPPPPRRLRPLERQGQVNQIPSNERNQQEPRVLPPRNRFSDFGLSDAEYNKGQNFGKRPNFRPDGAEYDEYGNRQKYENGNIPRGYDRRGDVSQEQFRPLEPQRPRPVYPSPKRTIDTNRKAIIDEVDPALLEELEAMPQPGYDIKPQPGYDISPQEDSYVPSSGPAFASPSNLLPVYANARADLGPGSLEANVLAGAAAASQPEGVYQNEERISFQIHGQEGPHSYRYGYDTGNGYNRQFKYEERTGEGYVTGRYGFYDKYGKLQVINYKSDPIHGFHAEGAAVPKKPQYPH